MCYRKYCSPSSDGAFKRGGSADTSLLFVVYLAHDIGLQILLIHPILRFLKASIILNVKMVQSDSFKFDGERASLYIDNA